MLRTSVIVVLLSTTLVIGWASAPVSTASQGRSMPSGKMIAPLRASATEAIDAWPVPAYSPVQTDWAGDVLIDTAYVADFAVDWSLADGTMWLAEALLQDSVVKIFRSTDHGARWDSVFAFHTVPRGIVHRVGLVLGEGESSYVNVFFLSPAENGNVGVFRLKPDLSYWDGYWVAGGPDSITDFAVCRDYRNSYSLYCWAVVGDSGYTAPFLWSRDYGKTWVGTYWTNVLDPFLAPSAGPRVNIACANYRRTYVTAGFNYNYGDSTSWDYRAVNIDTFHCYRPKMAAANTEPDSEATRWVMYTKDYQNTGDWDIRYAVRSPAWADTWQKERVFSQSSIYWEGEGDIQNYKAIGNMYVNTSYSMVQSSTLDTSNVYWTWTNAINPYGWAVPQVVNDSGTLAAQPAYASKIVYSPGAPASGGGVVYSRAGFLFLPHGLYFDAPWNSGTAVAERSRRGALRLTIAPSVARGPVDVTLPMGTERVTLFDASGRAVRTIAAASRATRWDLRNDAGARVAPGVYVLRAESRQGAASGKIVVR